MKLGIVGPQENVEKVNQLILQEFPQIEPHLYIYQTYSETPALLANQQEQLDALLFIGKASMTYAEKQLQKTILWDVIPRSGSSLLQVLLKITLAPNLTIFNVSSDLYYADQLTEIFDELSVDPKKLTIHFFNKNIPIDDGCLDAVCAFHEQLYHKKQVSCCITAFYEVNARLSAKNIPCFLIAPTNTVIRETLYRLQLNHLLEVSQQSQIVVLCARIDSIDEYSVFNENEYQYIFNKTNVSRQIYLFAQRIKAAVIEVGTREFLLFSTKHILEDATNNFQNIDLLSLVKENTASTISLGIGYGQTAQDARRHANVGMQRADRLGGNTAFIVYEEQKIIGPIYNLEDHHLHDDEPRIDKKFFAISEKTAISVNTLFRLSGLVKQQGKTRFTAAELSALIGVSSRTINRTLTKLILHGFCFEVGKRILSQAGRPSRIVEIKLP